MKIHLNKRGYSFDFLFRKALYCASCIVFLILIGLIVLMGKGSGKAFSVYGLSFVLDKSWNPVTDHYGALAPLLGTIVSTIIAIIIAIPISLGTAFWLKVISPPKYANIISLAIQLLAAVPSIIFGMWGFFIIVPFMAGYVQPFLNHYCVHIPLLGSLTYGAPFGVGLMTAGIILAIMITPFMTSIIYDIFDVVPIVLCESAYSLGATKWEVMRYIILPASKNGIISAILLGMGRSLGETMAVTFVIGNVMSVGLSLFTPRSTVSSLIALQFPESAQGSLSLSSLMALGFILLLLSFLSMIIARFFRKVSD